MNKKVILGIKCKFFPLIIAINIVIRVIIAESYEGQSKITESWLISFYWVGSFG